MSNEQHEVTVYDRAPATAPVSVAQVEAYLRRTGWQSEESTNPSFLTWTKIDSSGEHMLTTPRPVALDSMPSRIAICVAWISDTELRAASAVLADIAREPAP